MKAAYAACERVYSLWRALMWSRLRLGFMSQGWVKSASYNRDGERV